MSNDEMKPGRFLKLFKGRQKMAWIREQFAAGRRVIVCTYTQGRIYKSVDQFKLGKSGSVYVARGKNWDCIDGCGLQSANQGG